MKAVVATVPGYGYKFVASFGLTAVPRHPEPTRSSCKNVYQTLMARNVRGVQAEPYFARLVVQGTLQGQ
jgi:DNA-binding winged helix-turn-helix (wHTH) protein